MKKVMAFISVLLTASAVLFADISAKKNADGSYEVTFFYGNPRATEVLLAGDFTNWQSGALPMEKGEKGFSLTKTFPADTSSATYKFIVDGSWTTDIKAPMTIDDGFGGKNAKAEFAMIAGGGEGAVHYPMVNYKSWTILGSQIKYSTQDPDKIGDKTKKENHMENVAVGFKSYHDLSGDLTGNMPFFVEVVLAEQDYEDANVKLYDRANSQYENTVLRKRFWSDIFSDPQAYLAKDHKDNVGDKGSTPPTSPFLGHLKFGWNTPYVNYTGGYKYAKLPMRQAITWSTVADNWDAGYQNVGGYSLFENGEKLQQFGDVTVNFGLNLNRSADRKGENYGQYSFVLFDIAGWKLDAQWNTMFGKEYQFDEAIENDVIVGAKGRVGDITIAVQGLVAVHNKSTHEILGDTVGDDGKTTYDHAGDWWKAADYFGYSTDIFYRSDKKVDGIESLAGNARIGYAADIFDLNVEYRFRGAQASMLYIRNNHDDNDLRLKDMLGAPNSQKVTVDFGYDATDVLSLGLKASGETELKHYSVDDDTYVGINHCWANGYANSSYNAIFLDKGAEFEFEPSFTYDMEDKFGFASNIQGYTIMDYAAFKVLGATDDYKYSASDSKFLFKYAGLSFNAEGISDTIKGLNVYYGLDNAQDQLLFNTLLAKVSLPMNIEVTGGIGLRSVKGTDAADTYDKDTLNPFGFALGVAKKLGTIKSPKVYAQYVWNMDAYKSFGDGPTELNIKNGANLGDWKYVEGLNRYDGEGAIRLGMFWNF